MSTSGHDEEEARRAAVLRLAGEEGDLAELVEALGDQSWRVRKEAAGVAAAWPDLAAAAAALVEALAEPENVGRRNAAVDGLVRIGLPALPPLVDALGHRPEHRKLIIDALGLIGDRRAAAPLAHSLDDPDPNVRAAAAEALGSVGGTEAEAALARALDRGELVLTLACLDGLNRMGARLPVARLAPLAATPVLRPAVLEALGWSGDPTAVPHLLAGLPSLARGTREAAAAGLSRILRHLDEKGDEPGRRAVEGALAALPDDAERMLVEALLEGAPASRRAAAVVLGHARRVSATRALALALGDPGVSEAAADALALIGPAAVPALCGLAPELDASIRCAIFAVLPRLGAHRDAERAGLRLLERGLRDDEPEVAAAAAVALGEVGDRASVQPLVEVLSGTTRVAMAAAHALVRLAEHFPDEIRALVVVRGVSRGDGPHVVRVLGALAKSDDAPLLLAALRADSPGVRRAAAESVAVHGGAEVDDALLFALRDEIAEVRAAAARSLGARSSVRAVAALAEACGDADASVRAAAARALGAIGGEASLEALRALARSADGVTSVHALEALGRAGDRSDEELLVRALERDDVEVAKAAARALGAVGNEAAAAALARALSHPRWDVRRVAAQALGERGGATAAATLRDRLSVEEDALVREALAAAIERAARR